MRDKYANKGTISKIFHKYTGYITVGIILSIVFISWSYYESESVFFETWSCEAILSMPLDKLSPKEFLRYEEIKGECSDMYRFAP